MPIDTHQFKRDGFLVLPRVVPRWEFTSIRRRIEKSLDPLAGPVEYEADVAYRGAPKNKQSPGGSTPRRLLQALDRNLGLHSLVFNPAIVTAMRKLLQDDRIAVSQAHHNCVMTKFPGFSSDTDWHRDYRYWAFEKPRLISAWFALQDESYENGSLELIPGSHNLRINENRFDEYQFLRDQEQQNRQLIGGSLRTHLRAGDVLLFDCQLLHSAQRNRTEQVKISPVFTFHPADNPPIPGTRSAALPSIPCKDLF